MKQIEISKIKISQELKKFMRPLSTDELDKLKKQINNDGEILTPLDIDQDNTLLDGHNRLSIATKMGLTKVPVLVHKMKDLEESQAFMINRQLGRRNLTPQEFTYFIGWKYSATKKDKSEAAKKAEIKMIPAAEKIAKDHSIGSATVKRASQVYSAVEELEDEKPGTREKYLSGDKKTVGVIKEHLSSGKKKRIISPEKQAARDEEHYQVEVLSAASTICLFYPKIKGPHIPELKRNLKELITLINKIQKTK